MTFSWLSLDYDHVLFDGPWMVADQYITVRQWQANFDHE